jgi:leucyl-tRNA synthetase
MASGTEVFSASDTTAYHSAVVEQRWQEAWTAAAAFATPPEGERESAYVFAGCPFTSGDAHMGHIRSYTIADAYARFCRARGLDVLFSLGFDAFGLPAELEALRRGISPQAWVARCIERMRGQFERLGYSCDWARTFDSSQPDHYRWTQWLFVAMLQAGLVYERTGQVSWCDSCRSVLAAMQAEGGQCWRCHGPVRLERRQQWFMRISAYVGEQEQGLEALPGWTKAAMGGQRTVIGRVEGAEVLAAADDGRELTVFTPHAEAIAGAEFIALSPAHPDVEAWTADAAVRAALEGVQEAGGSRRGDRDATQAAVLDTGETARIAGVARPLRVVVSPLVDARFGPTAALGIPAVDATDRSIAQRLQAPHPLENGGADPDPRPAVRYRARDIPISRQRAWGAPVPLIFCDACGTVPVPLEDLPVRLPEDLQITGEGNPLDHPAFTACACPECGAPATRSSDTIDCHVDGMWMWMPICVPYEDRPQAMFDHAEYARWLPARQIVWGADAAGYMFDQRLIGRLLQDFDMLPPVPDGEVFTRALMHEMVRLDGRKMSKHLGNVIDPNALVEEVGADTVRLAVLYAAAPGNSFNWNDQPVLYCRKFMETLWSYGAPRLREWEPTEIDAIDLDDKWRRRLRTWCAAAAGRIAGDFEQLEMHRAARNAMLLLTRIQDFERRVLSARGELEEKDRGAVAGALLLLVQVVAPLTPHIAEELWAVAGREPFVSQAPWPAVSPVE